MRKSSLHFQMFLRLLLRATLVRRGRTLTAMIAVIIAATTATAMLNLYLDVESKLTKDFRRFGANIVLAAPEGKSISPEDLSRIQRNLSDGDSAVPVAYAIARTPSGKPVTVAGTDLAAMRKLNPWWSVTSGAVDDFTSTPLLGERAASLLASDRSLILLFQRREMRISNPSLLRTGGPEDNRIYLPLGEFQRWTNVQPRTVEIWANGATGTVNAKLQELRKAFPALEVQPLRQVLEAETRVLGKTRSVLLAATTIIIVLVAFCILATLTSSVLERRRDFALMKALGSSQRSVSAIFLAESAFLGFVGAVIGFASGCGLAAWIGRVNFHAPVMPRLSIFPAVLAGCLVVTLLSSLLPLSRLRKLEPALMLKGD